MFIAYFSTNTTGSSSSDWPLSNPSHQLCATSLPEQNGHKIGSGRSASHDTSLLHDVFQKVIFFCSWHYPTKSDKLRSILLLRGVQPHVNTFIILQSQGSLDNYQLESLHHLSKSSQSLWPLPLSCLWSDLDHLLCLDLSLGLKVARLKIQFESYETWTCWLVVNESASEKYGWDDIINWLLKE